MPHATEASRIGGKLDLAPRIDGEITLCALHVHVQADDVGYPNLLSLHQDGGIIRIQPIDANQVEELRIVTPTRRQWAKIARGNEQQPIGDQELPESVEVWQKGLEDRGVLLVEVPPISHRAGVPSVSGDQRHLPEFVSIPGPDEDMDKLGEGGWRHDANTIAGPEVMEELGYMRGWYCGGIKKRCQEKFDENVGVYDDDGWETCAGLGKIDDATRHLDRHRRPRRLLADHHSGALPQ